MTHDKDMELNLQLSDDEMDEFQPIDLTKKLHKMAEPEMPDEMDEFRPIDLTKKLNKMAEPEMPDRMEDKINIIKKNLKRPFQDLEDQEVVINEKYFRKNNQDSIKILPNPSSSLDKTVTSTLPGFQHTIAELLFDIVNNLNLK